MSACSIMCGLSRTDNYSEVNGLQLDRRATLGSASVKTVVVLPSSSAGGTIQFSKPDNITGWSLCLPVYFVHYIVHMVM